MFSPSSLTTCHYQSKMSLASQLFVIVLIICSENINDKTLHDVSETVICKVPMQPYKNNNKLYLHGSNKV